MTDDSGLLEVPSRYERVVGQILGSEDGPTVIVMAGLHGNEPAGLRGAERLLQRLSALRSQLRGRIFVLAGNLRALEQRSRFIDYDLNRCWQPSGVAALRNENSAGRPRAAEDDEQRQLLERLEAIVHEARGPVYFFDVHTSSADGPPFVTVGDTLRNRNFALQFPVPLILGLEEQVDGALLEYLNNFGPITMGVEAGRHDAPASVDRVEAVLSIALVATGLIDRDTLPGLSESVRLLREASAGTPRIVEVRSRHAIEPDDGFRMEPGFTNFESVRKGQVLGRDKHGPVLCPEHGRVLLPLYQGQGDDGFFVSREVRRVWLRVSTVVRRLRLGALIRLLPGVHKHPSGSDVLVVDTRIARLYPLETFHLFGFRKLRSEGRRMIVSRRSHDLSPPPGIVLS